MTISDLNYWEAIKMIRMNIEDFIYEVKEEMMCYDEIGDAGADKWESEFREWL